MKGRAIDLKYTPALSASWNRRMKKALRAKERGQGKKLCQEVA
jgi:hypothetical protein